MSDLRREVVFTPGYNYLHETGPNRRGQAGMNITFLLIGEPGAVHFVLSTMWTPLGPIDEGSDLHEPVHVDYTKTIDYGYGGSYTFGLVPPPTGVDRGHHWRKPLYEGEMRRESGCLWLGGEPCYSDGSGLAADGILRAFIERGDAAVWEALEEYYAYCLSEEEVMAR